MDRSDAEELDRADELAPFRERFVIDDPDLVYANGNSLGRLPRETVERVADVLTHHWGSRLARSWDDGWLDEAQRVGDVLAAGVLGARPGEVLVCDSTTVNLYKLAVAALDARPDRRSVVVASHEFPTDRYVLQGLAQQRGLALQWDGEPDRDTALCVRSLVDYRTGARADLAARTAADRAAGALTVWDLSHAAGAVPVNLEAAGVDMAVGCTYKYLCAGPGAPAYLYVRAELQQQLQSPIWGWFGQRHQFAMGPTYDPQHDIRRFHAGTSPIAGIAAVDVGASLVAEAGIDRMRAKSIALTSLAIDRFDAWLAPLGFTLATPRDAKQRGGHVSVCRADAAELCARAR
ncbi:MAG: aminotransferase class V-fold PLP-dependent enzyme, partial [Actinobacteria bacterium]|nr:aminotransferase class V-fold PLP-dependent enzyme [Actinomycetota bacterium]